MKIAINSRERKLTLLKWLQRGEIDTSDVEEWQEFLDQPFLSLMKRAFVDTDPLPPKGVSLTDG